MCLSLNICSMKPILLNTIKKKERERENRAVSCWYFAVDINPGHHYTTISKTTGQYTLPWLHFCTRLLCQHRLGFSLTQRSFLGASRKRSFPKQGTCLKMNYFAVDWENAHFSLLQSVLKSTSHEISLLKSFLLSAVPKVVSPNRNNATAWTGLALCTYFLTSDFSLLTQNSQATVNRPYIVYIGYFKKTTLVFINFLSLAKYWLCSDVKNNEHRTA